MTEEQHAAEIREAHIMLWELRKVVLRTVIALGCAWLMVQGWHWIHPQKVKVLTIRCGLGNIWSFAFRTTNNNYVTVEWETNYTPSGVVLSGKTVTNKWIK